MTAVASHTVRWRIIRYAIAGAIVLNIVTVVWAFNASAGTITIAAILQGILGAALGGSIGWATTPNREGRWWAQGRPRRLIRGHEPR
jgi:hypothetical protein